MTHNLRYALENRGVKTHNTSNTDEFSIQCIFCSDHKSRLNINEAKGLYFCYHRGCTGHISKIIKHFKLDYEVDFEVRPNPLFKLREKLRTMSLKGEKDKTTPICSLDISKFDPIVGSSSLIAKRAKQYLENRGFTEQQIINYNLRYESIGKYANRIIVPFFENGKFVYFQARSFINCGLKVLNPSKTEAHLGKSQWLFNYDKAKKFSTYVIICEGWASAMSAGYNAISIQGMTVSEAQLFKLLSWKKFIIMLDAGRITEATKIAKKLKMYTPEKQIFIANLPYGDPNEITKEELKQAITRKKEYKVFG